MIIGCGFEGIIGVVFRASLGEVLWVLLDVVLIRKFLYHGSAVLRARLVRVYLLYVHIHGFPYG